jgi:hypothetical protein
MKRAAVNRYRTPLGVLYLRLAGLMPTFRLSAMFDAVQTTLSQELPFPYNKRPFCRYEPIEKRIGHARVLIVNSLLRYESDLSDLAKTEWNGTTETKL